ncbi:MAG TPA: DNA-binding response regulator [Oribacterium sp.]|nr:DNA-binding response regulator [Oribacterium sp.]
MNKYKVMLVDDEEDVIRVIIHKMDWEKLGFTVQGYAHNGLEALEMAEEEQPDVVMTDIKMPFMDGLELSRRLKEQYPTIKIIIFSGFDQFEYAKEAIRLEAEEYILKPIDAEELRTVFERIHGALDQEFDEKQNINMLKNYYMESLPILQENFYTALIEGREPANALSRDMMDYQISLEGPYFAVVILHNSLTLAPEGINPLLITMSVRRLWEEHLDAKWHARFFTYLGDTVLIVQLEQPTLLTKLTDDCQVLCRLSKHVSNATITAGISKVVNHVLNLPEAYESAREASSYRVIYGRGQAINIMEVAPETQKENVEAASSEDSEDRLYPIFKAIKLNTPEELDRQIDAFLAKEAPVSPSLQEYRFFVLELVTELHRFMNTNHLSMEAVFGKDEDLLQKVQHFDLQALAAWTKESTHRMQALLRASQSDSTRNFVAKAEAYVHENYRNKDLSVESICDYLGISAAYFSTVFKRETGKTFINYLTDIRMERAVHMLLDENEKTYVIAEAVGYSDPNYFSYAFKKKFGVSPSKYKAQQKAGSDVTA